MRADCRRRPEGRNRLLLGTELFLLLRHDESDAVYTEELEELARAARHLRRVTSGDVVPARRSSLEPARAR
jgi:hypothetical protein